MPRCDELDKRKEMEQGLSVYCCLATKRDIIKIHEDVAASEILHIAHRFMSKGQTIPTEISTYVYDRATECVLLTNPTHPFGVLPKEQGGDYPELHFDEMLYMKDRVQSAPAPPVIPVSTITTACISLSTIATRLHSDTNIDTDRTGADADRT